MGFVGGLLGVNGGAGGTGFASPQAANIQTPTTAQQATDQYNNAQTALQQQQAFANAVQPGGQQALASQQQLLQQLGQQAQGIGPNPAAAQLAQSTAANTANQAALMAGQRGANQNAGLIARQAAQQGAANQQAAAGQAATMSAQQQLAARQQLAAQQAQMIGQQQQATGAYTGATQAEQQNILNAIGAQNTAQVGSQESVNSANAQLAKTQLQGQQALLGGGANAAGSALSMLFADGGQVSREMYADGGASLDPLQPAQPAAPTSGPKSSFGQFLMGNKDSSGGPDYGNSGANALAKGVGGMFDNFSKKPAPTESIGTAQPWETGGGMAGGPMDNSSNAPAPMPSDDQGTAYAARGGKVPALVSPGEQYLPPKDVKKVIKDGKNPLEVGERIPGKPKHPGNDYRNDTVKKTLKEGGMVIPNEVMQSKNPHFEAMKFVHAHIAKNRDIVPKKVK